MKNSKGVIIVVAIIAVLAVLMISSYNSTISKVEDVDTKLANLDVMLQRRADLIPNLINTVKGNTQHEDSVIDKVVDARSKLVNANTVEEKAEANNELSNSVKSLLVIAEAYPELQSSASFVQLSDELAGSENRIATARKDYNESVKTLNSTIKKFPNNILSGIFGFKTASYFEADEKSSEVPNVTFEYNK